MNLLGIFWIIIIGIWLMNRAQNQNKSNTDGVQRLYNDEKNVTPTDGYKKVKPNNIYNTKEKDLVKKELEKATTDSIENAKTLYETGIISKEEYREFKQSQKRW